MSLVKAIQDKYCPVEPEVVSDIIGADCIHSVQQSGLFLAPGGCSSRALQLASLYFILITPF